MKRFNFVIILVFLFVVFLLAGVSGCSLLHTCNFNKKITTSDYLCNAASCEEAASYWYSCECGNKSDTIKFYVGNARGHNFVGATCISDVACSRCSQVQPALGHDYKAATCTEPKTCIRCSSTIDSPLGHNYSEATCTKAKACTRCSITSGTSLGHNYTAATCTKPKTCTRCSSTSGSSLGHNYTAATCTKPKTCTRCSSTSGSSLGHNYTAATCTEPKTCTRCSNTTGSALGHNYETVISWATDFSQCTAALVCKNNHEHILKEETVITSYVKDSDALCLTAEKGHYVGVFSSSEFKNIEALSKSITKGNSLGHSFTNYVLDNNATCTKDATKTAVCDRCTTKDTLTVSGTKLGHSFSNYVLDNNATCTKNGTKTAVCDRCTASDTKTIYGSKLDHSYTRKSATSTYLSKEATCISKAIYYYSCTCGAKGTSTFEYVNLAEHDYLYSESDDDTLHIAECKICNKSITEQHSFTNSECVCGYKKGLSFTLNSDNKSYSVSKGNCTDTDIIIPSSYNGLPVTCIGKNAFASSTEITSITIPNTITKIDGDAFYSCPYITKINFLGSINEWVQIEFASTYSLPISTKKLYINGELLTQANITTANKINLVAFNRCTSLTSVTIGDSVKSIGGMAFYGCSNLTSVTIGNNVTSIGSYAFDYCISLKNLTIGKNVKSIGWKAFYDCESLTKVNFLGTIDSWASIEFEDEFSNPTLYYAKNLYINNKLQTNITINSNKINNYAFAGCTSLTNVAIGNNVKSIGDCAFYKCSSLTSIKIPNSVTSIGESAFYNCEKLKSVTFDSNSRLYKIGCEAFYGCSSLTSIVIPTTVTSIGNKAFYGCDNLESVEFECTSLWFVSTYEGGYSNVILVDYPIRNALHLTTTYCDYYWYCK